MAHLAPSRVSTKTCSIRSQSERQSTSRRITVHSPLDDYFRDIDGPPLLTAQEEKQLAYRVEDGDAAARDYLTRANLRLVVAVARDYQGKGVPFEDLIEEGNLGLLRAVTGFDPRKNTRFSTYAVYWIKQSIQRAIVNAAHLIRVPNYLAGLLVKYRQAEVELSYALGRVPTPDEITQRMNLPLHRRRSIANALRVRNHVPPITGKRKGLELVWTDPHTEAPEYLLDQADEVRQLLHSLGQLAPREALILRLRFGLAGEQPRTLNEIGKRLGLTRERVRQLEQKALEKLREKQERA